MARPKKNRQPRKKVSKKISMQGPIQFNWRRHWSKKVAPLLNEKLVQFSLNLGMSKLDRSWKPGDAPCDYGAIGDNQIVKGKLSWYQPLNRCHYIAFFSMAIGVLNYPALDWRFVSGDYHTVPVGYGPDGEPHVVMDILLFERFTAEESIAHARKKFEEEEERAKANAQWEQDFADYLDQVLPLLKERARKLRSAKQEG